MFFLKKMVQNAAAFVKSVLLKVFCCWPAFVKSEAVGIGSRSDDMFQPAESMLPCRVNDAAADI